MKGSLYILCILLSQELFGQKSIELNSYLDKDFLSEEIKIKEEFKSKAAKQIYKEKQQRYLYPNYEDFWSFASEYWLVKNVSKIKWDRSFDSSQPKKEFQSILNTMGYKNLKIKVFIFPTSWMSHFVLPQGQNKYLFFVSQSFIQKAGLKPRQVALLLLEDLVRMEQGFLFEFLKKENFFNKFGKDFFLNKKPEMAEFEKLMGKISFFFKHHGYSFEQDYLMSKALAKKLKSYPILYSRYQQYVNHVSEQEGNLKESFPNILGVYPGAFMKKSWVK